MSKPHRTLLVIDDSSENGDASYQHQLQKDSTFSYTVLTQGYNAHTVELCRSEQIEGILLVFRPPCSHRLNFLSQLKKQMGENCPPMIVIDNGELETAVQAFKNGAIDYLVKERTTPDDLRLAIRNAIKNTEKQQELQRSRECLQKSVEKLLDCLGVSSSKHDQSVQMVDLQIDELLVTLIENQKQLEERLIQEIADRHFTEQQLRAVSRKITNILENMTDAFVALDRDWRITYVNQMTARLNQTSAEELIGRSHWDVWADTKGTVAEEYYNWAIAEQMPIHFEYFYESRQRWYEIHAYPSPDGLGIYYRDINDRKKAEALLRENQIQLQQRLVEIETIYQSAPIGLNILDNNLRFVRINQRLAEINGLPIEAHIGRTVREVLPDLADTAEQLLRPILATGEPLLNVEIHGETPAQPGVKRTWLEHFLPLKHGDQVIGISTVCEEITERIQAEAALRQSEEQFRSMADNAPVMIWVTDANGYCTYLSKSWYDFTGQTEATGLGLGWLDAVHPEDYEFSKDRFLRANEQRQAFRLEYRLRHKDGEYHWAIDAASPWFGESGELKGYIGSVIDISDRKRMEAERKQAEEALRQSEDRLRMAIKSARLGTWDWNLVTNELLWDAGCKAIFDLLPDAEINMEIFFKILHPEDRERMEQVIKWSCHPASGGHYDAEYRIIGIQDGRERWIAAKGQVYFDADGKPLRFIGTVLDVTERKQAAAQQEQLLQREQSAREAAERANRMKDEFLAILSHELRSPLNPILGWSKLLQTRKLDETKVTEALATIERNAKLQTQLINDLLDVAKILRGKLIMDLAPTDLGSVIESAIETVKTTAIAKSISLHPILLDIGQVAGDATRLQQIFWNLLSNAIKFTPSGGKVDILLERVGSQAQVTVSDTGKGISPDFLPHIFELFRQEDVSTTRKYGGLGLGLSIVRQLVEAHGGTIEVESPGEGLGATFTVRLPLLNGELKSNQTDELPQELDLTGIRVLTVDDEPDARELLTVLLTQYGATVKTVISAAEVLATLESFQPHVLVSDIGMPNIDGYDLLQQVRALPSKKGGQIPAIALTAYAREEDQQRALNSGFQRYIAKPIEPNHVVQTVADLVKGKEPPFGD